MSLVKTKPLPQAARDFINAAPDHGPGYARGKKSQFNMALPGDILRQIDALARQRAISRTAQISIWIMEGLERETK